MKNQQIYDQIQQELQLYDLQSVADIAGCSPWTLQTWINGTYKPSFDLLIRVSNTMGFDVELKK